MNASINRRWMLRGILTGALTTGAAASVAATPAISATEKRPTRFLAFWRPIKRLGRAGCVRSPLRGAFLHRRNNRKPIVFKVGGSPPSPKRASSAPPPSHP
jgi:hypothetical protein